MMIDPVTDRLYWANFADGLGKTISYANLDGSGGGDLIADIGADRRGAPRAPRSTPRPEDLLVRLRPEAPDPVRQR